MNFNEGFSEGSSIIHRLDPRVRILSALAFSLVISVSDRFYPVFLGLIAALIIAALARLQVKNSWCAFSTQTSLSCFCGSFSPLP